MSVKAEEFTGRIIFMFNDISWRYEENEQECKSDVNLVSIYARRFHQEDGADTQFSVPRVHCPEERSKAKVVENYRYTSVPMGIRLKLFFAQ